MGRVRAILALIVMVESAGCLHPAVQPEAVPPDRNTTLAAVPDPALLRTQHEDQAAAPEWSQPGPGAVLAGPQPVDVYIQMALSRNPSVRAAWLNVQALRERVPQVTSLDDPILSNTIFPIPSVAPQFSLMGYMPYDVLLAQQFPWFGTLRLRGQAAEQDVQIALFELAATQLDVVASVKRAYFDLHFNERAEALLRQNRGLAEDFLAVARERYQLGTATQADVLRAEVALSDVDRELETLRGSLVEARSELVRLLQLDPDAEPATLPELPDPAVPKAVEHLYQLAITARPDLQGRLAAIGRDERAIELARKRYRPNLTLGMVYQDMEKRNAMTPQTAGGMPNVGLFVGLNLPIYRGRLAAGVREAQARAGADAALYEVERDQSHRDIKDLFTQADVQRRVIALLRRTNLPAARQVFETTANDYRAGNAGVDYLNVIAAWRDALQVELQIAQLEAELGKTLASLERAVGVAINEHPPDPAAVSVPPPEERSGPFTLPADTAPAPIDNQDKKAVPR